MHPPLPDSWVDKVFARLLVRYGAAWLSKWQGIDTAAVKADWALRLAGFQQHPEAITYALDHLPPDWPPNVEQFARLCNQAPRAKDDPDALGWTPAPIPPVVAKALADVVIKASDSRIRKMPKAWADKLREREIAAQQKLTKYQRAAWREALGMEEHTD